VKKQDDWHVCTGACDPPTSHVLTREEIVASIERQSRKRHGITATELVQAYRAGLLNCHCGALDIDVLDILMWAGLLEKGDPLYVP
jgi:hypothetical protein